MRYSYSGDGTADENLPLMTIHAIFYKQADFAAETLRSMLAQTYGNVEVIASDDCSPDGTAEVLLDVAREYKGPHRLIVNVNDSNMGIGDHFACVNALSHGEWLTSLGGDDLAEPDYLQTIYNYAKRYPDVVAIGCAATTIDEEGHVTGEAYKVAKAKLFCRYEFGIPKLSLNPDGDANVFIIAGCVSTYKRRLLEILPFPKGLMAEDLFLSFRAALMGDVLAVPEKCVRQRINSNSISRAGHRAHARAARKAYRRKMMALTFLSTDAALNEIPVIRPDVDSRFCDEVSEIASESLLGSFALADPFGGNLPRYLDAFRRVRRAKSTFAILAKARACGVLIKTFRLMMKGALKWHQ